MSATMKQRIAGANQTDSIINFLRGDTSNEGAGIDKLRPRDGATLPAFVNSPPLYVKGLVNAGYTWDGYADFYTTKAQRNGMVFIGGGGSFLHGFDAQTGVEKFAYMPKGVQTKASILADRGYGSAAQEHQYFVDGPALEADAYINGAWRNLLIGTLGAGGRGVYAIDVTDEAKLSNPSTAAGQVLWDYSGEDDSDLGYIHTTPEVGRVDGTWYAFIPNGTHSTTGATALFAINLQTKVTTKIIFDSSSGGGMTGVRLLRQQDREAAALYGVDLKGRVWRLDFEGKANPSEWRKGFGGVPLFEAKNGLGTPQPITVKPTLARHYLGGYSVLFGTGKLLDAADPDSVAMQSLYGVWDPTGAEPSSVLAPWSTEVNQRMKFLEQKIRTVPVLIDQVDGSKKTFFRTSSESANWENQRGWFMDLTLPSSESGKENGNGQRLIYEVDTSGEFAFFYTVKPSGTPQPCETSSGMAYNFIVESVTGAAYDLPVIDLQGDGLVNDNDKSIDPAAKGYFISGFSSASTGRLFRVGGNEGAGSGELWDVENRLGYKTYCLKLDCKISDRVWKQIISPPQPK
jgi:type IV pilus assembly protein PilY1